MGFKLNRQAACGLALASALTVALAPVGARLAAAQAPSVLGPLPDLRLIRLASGFTRPVHVTHAGDGSNRLFVVEQERKVRIVQDGQVLPDPFLDLSGRVTFDAEACR